MGDSTNSDDALAPRLPLGKTCNKCGNWKLYEQFSRHKKSKDGRNWTCKSCASKYNRRWREENPDYAASWLETNPHYKKQWYKANEQRERERRRRRRREKAEEEREYHQRYREQHREWFAEWHRQWREANPDKVKAIVARYWERNKERAAIQNLENGRRYRARKLGAEGSYTNEEFDALCEKYGNVCLCCGGGGPLTADHVIPLTLGGSDYIDNIQPLCRSCNSKKFQKTTDYRY